MGGVGGGKGEEGLGIMESEREGEPDYVGKIPSLSLAIHRCEVHFPVK